MSQLSPAHATVVMERPYPAAPQRVFEAWANLEARRRWPAALDKLAREFS